MRLPKFGAIAGFLLAAILSAPAWASGTSAQTSSRSSQNFTRECEGVPQRVPMTWVGYGRASRR